MPWNQWQYKHVNSRRPIQHKMVQHTVPLRSKIFQHSISPSRGNHSRVPFYYIFIFVLHREHITWTCIHIFVVWNGYQIVKRFPDYAPIFNFRSCDIFIVLSDTNTWYVQHEIVFEMQYCTAGRQNNNLCLSRKRKYLYGIWYNRYIWQ